MNISANLICKFLIIPMIVVGFTGGVGVFLFMIIQ